MILHFYLKQNYIFVLKCGFSEMFDAAILLCAEVYNCACMWTLLDFEEVYIYARVWPLTDVECYMHNTTSALHFTESK